MGILSGNPKEEPLHYGEIFGVWSFSMASKGKISCYQIYQNHAGDSDLKKILEDMIEEAKLQEAECDQLLNDNGIVPAPSLPSRPHEPLESIPAGARFSDAEIASAITVDNSAFLVACSQVIGSAIREDVGTLFAKYHTAKATLGVRLLRLNKEKGWLIPPPLEIKNADLVGV